MSKKILVLGATGTVGKPLVEGLLAKGEAVKAASRANRKMDGVESTPFDFGKPETIATALEGVDRTYMLLPAGYLNVRDLLLPFVEAAASRKVKIVFQSAFGVDANDANPMRQMEILLEKSGTPHVILRPNWFSDNFHHFWKASLDQGQIALPAGDSRTVSSMCAILRPAPSPRSPQPLSTAKHSTSPVPKRSVMPMQRRSCPK
ncbi:NAD(P)H-binding protein [Pseudomonas aeruginosa]|nr:MULTISPECIES: NAD(P)H-binding protein [Pseudomonas]AVK21748.1 NADH(P)-binding family protein [Pseudomonas aeruginosa]MCA4041026.1 NAD(P)H-binding protein [Pseudomonas aeruginosa]MCC0288688.1 NAD(P)H-binding protein [Pseudomonas aeruginosa]MCC0397165.1 NAD(P)H-binding protein [Pseudomonas aeruginosa]MCS7517029.1 NAD(P)H-binding protein [Pseudomonas aeruginosa]